MHKSVKWIRNIIIVIFLLVILFIIILQTPFAKNLVRGKLEAYLTTKTGGQFHIASIDYRLPNWIQMGGVTVQNKAGDTILSGEKIRVDMNLFKLMRGKYEINKITLERVYVDAVKKSGDSTFNYQFLIDAFSTKPSGVQKDTTPLVLSLQEIHILQSGLKWVDPAGGTALHTTIGKMDLLIDSLDLYKSRYHIREAAMSDFMFNMHITPNTITDTNSIKTTLPYVKLGVTRISKSHLIYKDDIGGIYTDDILTDLQFTSLNLQPWGSILMDRVLLSNSDINVNRPPFNNVKVRLDTISGKLVYDSLGVFHIREAILVNDNFVYNDVSKPETKKAFDVFHIDLKNVMANAHDIDYTGKIKNASVAFASAIDKSGFVLDSLYGNFAISDSVINVNNFLVRTPRSVIKGSAYLYPKSFVKNGRNDFNNTIRFTNNIISRKDLELLAPGLVRGYSKQLQGITTLYVTAEADGNARKMVIHHLTAHSDRNDISIDASGIVTDALSANSMRFDARIYQLNLTRNVVEGFMDPKTRQQVQLPSSFQIKGAVRGGMTELDNDLSVNSGYGLAMIKGKLRNYMAPQKMGYNLRIIAKNLETGKWVKQGSLFGKANGTVSLKGSGMDYKTAAFQSGIDLASFRIKQHVYTGIHVDLAGRSGTYDFKGNTKDPLLVTNFNGTASMGNKYPSIKSFINVQNANPFALGLYADSLSFKTKANIDLKDIDPSSLNAFVRLDSTVVFKNNAAYRMDSLLAKGYVDSGKTFITLNSSAMDAVVKGVYQYTELGVIFQQTFNRYTHSTATAAPVSNYSIDMAANIKPDPLYAVLIPGLFFDKNMSLRGRLGDSKSDSSRYLDLSVPALTYIGNAVTALKAHAIDIGDSLKFTAVADTVKVNALQLYTTSVEGGLYNNKLSANFSTNDQDGKERYAFAITGDQANSLYQVQLRDKLTLNYDNWLVNGNNTILFGKAGFNVNQLVISKGVEQIAVNSVGRDLNAPIDVKVDQFSLGNIRSLYNGGSLPLDGRLNAIVRVTNIDKNVPTFDGTLSIDSLQYQNVAMGKLAVKATATGAEAVTLVGSLSGNGNNIDVSGTYNQETINAQLNLNPIQLKSLDPFLQTYLAHSSGTLKGPITITGNVKSPEWNGTLRFDSVKTYLAQYGTLLRIDGQTIDPKYPVITLTHFTVKDSTGHEMLIDGTITQNKKQVPEANLTLKATDFIALSNTPVMNSQLYGIAVVDVDAKIKGAVTSPDISGNVALKDQSNITFVREPIIASTKEREAIMQFVDMDTVKNELIIPPAQIPRTEVDYGLINYNLNIDISKEAQFNVIVDPLTRDELQVKGAGQLNAGVSPNGDLSVTGAYNLTKGSYQMNYHFLKRKFELQEGSTLVFTGDPQNADADITAIYDINASPYDLIGNEVSNINTIDSKLYSQKIPFQVILKIKGSILTPQLQFDLKMKENVAGINYNFSTTVDNKLAQLRGDPSSMNKQVFGLLVLGRFIGEQSSDFFGTIGGFNGIKPDEIVKESVSRFLSDAVSRLASDIIKGVDINVNLRSAQDYSNASQRTDLNLALTKRFLDDRLSVTVGKSFTVQGEDPLSRGQQGAGGQPDITTSYKLSKDGRYMLKVYQRNQYEAILDGYFVETGIAFSLSMDYNKFNEILHKNRK